MRVLIQAGHSAAYPPFLAGGGGAPGEAGWVTDLAARLADRLKAAGVDVVLVGSWYAAGVAYTPPAAVNADYDLFLALHYDAPAKRAGVWDASGCFADRAPLDPSGAEADRFIAIWERRYVAATGIGLDVYRGVNNPNTDRYYAFSETSAATPGVLIEHGCGSPVPVGEYPAGADSAFLHTHLDLVAETDAAAVLEFLGFPVPGEDDDMATLNDWQRDMLSLMEAPLSLNADSVRQLVSDKAALEARVAELEAQPLPAAAPVGVKAVAVTLTDDRQEILAK